MGSQYKDLDISKYPFMGYIPNLIDYFLIIGYDSTFISKEIIKQVKLIYKKTIKKNPSKFIFEYIPQIYPTILSNIPSFQSHNNLMLENEIIINLIFPNSPKVFYALKTSNKPFPYSVNFGLYGDSNTSNDSFINKKIYNGYAYVFYEEKELSSINIYVPKVFCIISQYPYFNSFNKICEDILKLFNRNSIEIPIEILLFNLVNFTPSPISSGIRLTLFPNYSLSYYGSIKEKEDKQKEKEILQQYYKSEIKEDPKEEDIPFHSHYIDQLKGYPVIDFHLSEILNIFNISQLIQITIFSFLEIDLIFISENIENLNLVMYILSTFSYPLMDSTYLWHIVSIPKKDMNAHTSNPFVGKIFTNMIGVNCAFDEQILFELSLQYKVYFVVDIDKKQLHFNFDDEDEKAKVLSKQIQKLQKFIEQICDEKKFKTKFLEQAIFHLADTLNHISKRVGLDKYTKKNRVISFYNEGQVNKVLNTVIQEAFYNFVLNILKEFYSFYILYSKVQHEELNSTSISHSEIDTSVNFSTDDVNQKDVSAFSNDNPKIEKNSCEINEKIRKENTNYFLNYKENIEGYSEEERIFFCLFHDTSKFTRFIKEFIAKHETMELYRIPLSFAEEFILVKHASKDEFSSHYFEIIDNFYTTELKQLCLKLKNEKLKKELPITKGLDKQILKIKENEDPKTNKILNEGTLLWKAENYEEFFLIEREKQTVNFNAFYSFYGKELKTICYEILKNKPHVKTKATLVKGYIYTYKYEKIDLDNQLLIEYAHFILSQTPETIAKIFPSHEFIKNNEIIKANMYSLTNSIERILILLKIITTEHLLIYSFLNIFCTNLELFEGNDFDSLLKIIPSDLFCVRKYLTIIMSILYRTAYSKLQEGIMDDSIKEINKYLKYCRKIINFLNHNQILPNQQLSYLLECLYLLEQNIKERNSNSSNISISSDKINIIKDNESEEEALNESNSSRNKRFVSLDSTRLNIQEQRQYEFKLLSQSCNICKNPSKANLQDILKLTTNIGYDGCFMVCELGENCKQSSEKNCHKFILNITERDVNRSEQIEIYSPLKIYNTCLKISDSFYQDLNKEQLDANQIKIVVINLLFYFDNYHNFAKDEWSSKILFKYLTNLINK